MSAAADSATLADLLRLEHSVVFGYGAAGGRLAAGGGTMAEVDLLLAGYDAHRLRRDGLAVALAGRQVKVPTAEAAYRLPVLADAAAALAFAARLEADTARAYRAAAGALVERSLRALAVDAVTDAARRRTAILLAAGAPTTSASDAFPGS